LHDACVTLTARETATHGEVFVVVVVVVIIIITIITNLPSTDQDAVLSCTVCTLARPDVAYSPIWIKRRPQSNSGLICNTLGQIPIRTKPLGHGM